MPLLLGTPEMSHYKKMVGRPNKKGTSDRVAGRNVIWVRAKARQWGRTGPTFGRGSVTTILETFLIMSPLNLSLSARSPGTQGTRQGLGASVPVLVTLPGKLEAGHARPVVTGSHLASSSPAQPCPCCHCLPGVVTGSTGGTGDGRALAVALSFLGLDEGKVKVRGTLCSPSGWGREVCGRRRPAACPWSKYQVRRVQRLPSFGGRLSARDGGDGPEGRGGSLPWP